MLALERIPESEVLPHSTFETIRTISQPRPVTIVAPKRYAYDGFKRALDLVGATFLFAILLPLMALICVAVRCTSRGPAIFRQKRLTSGGRVFTMLKFRTMCRDAETTSGPVWASYCDPRVTRLGRILRVTRLDELPQLVNVIKGEMSLIGPRPERPEMAEKLSHEFASFSRRLEVKAGITGLAQIATGYASCARSYRRKLTLDIKYVENRCLMLDLRIALRTIQVIFTGFGAR